MAIAPHFAARQQFLTVLEEFFARGCARWQRRTMGWRSADELPPGTPAAPLLIGRFVREECGEAAHKLRQDIRKGAETETDVALRTRRAFDQFLVRMTRNPDVTATEVDELRAYFDRHYWPIEAVWLDATRALADRARLFAELGGLEAVGKIPTDVQAFADWSRQVIGEAYDRNDYRQALHVSEAIVAESAALVARFDDRDVVLGVCAAQQAASIATMVRLNCWAPEPGALLGDLDAILRQRVSLANLTAQERHDLGQFVTIATALKAACMRFKARETAEPSLLAIYRMLGYMRFHEGVRDQVAAATAAPVDSTAVTLMLSEAVNLRADWLRTFGLYRRMQDVPDFRERAHAQLSAALGDEEEPGLIDATLAFMAEPHALIDSEWAASEAGTASTSGWNDVALALLGVKVWLQQDGLSLADSHAWLNRAKARLDGCTVQLAWSDFYCACDGYMRERGNPILCDYALNSVRKLQRKAGNPSAVGHYEAQVLEVASRRKRRRLAGEAPDDLALQWFLREEPPPLAGGRVE